MLPSRVRAGRRRIASAGHRAFRSIPNTSGSSTVSTKVRAIGIGLTLRPGSNMGRTSG